MNKKLLKNFLVFSDGSFSLNFNKYDLKKVKYLNKDLKKYQLNSKQKLFNDFSDLNNSNNYRKKLFK